jgi:signal transduction histidine kinase
VAKRRAAVRRPAENPGLDISLQDVVDGVEDELLVIDGDYRVRFANLAACAKLPDETESPIGMLCYEVFHDRSGPCGSPLWDCPLRDVLQKGRAAAFVHTERTIGRERYLKITAYPLRLGADSVPCIVELRRDVSAERELETQILRRHHQLLALSHISRAVRGLWDLDGVLRVALDNVLEILNGAVGGILLFDAQSRTLSYRVQRGLTATYAEGMRMRLGEGIAGRVAQTGSPVLLEDVSKSESVARPDLVSAEGLKGFVSIPLRSKDSVVGVMNIASHVAGRFGGDDLSLLDSIGDYLGTAIEQAKLYDNLKRGRQRYQRLLQHSLAAQEEERKRIARELHDETSQTITSLTLTLQAITEMAEAGGVGDPEFMDRIRAAHASAILAGNEIVKLMKELRPTLLDELGLPAAIHRYARDTLQSHGIDVLAEFKCRDERFGPEVELTLFRIAQGAIGNILEHSGAKSASIGLECDDSECVLHVKDDGKGFDVSKLTRVSSSGRGAGLFTMKERAKLVGGRCRIKSQPGRGTDIAVRIPLAGEVIHEEDQGAGG